ncbi:tetratricopeptide repeat protein [Rheinheimera soli]|uniref:Tetratricopeptide (TPR) repeat protein n=1 Tax=Rheinheimera soli TaxID=443616 RepID=A0ABU1VY69_9GAMM|nr:tetratricopeptide repeat protein [Rheinheimera soli]MDR7120658.1 tetratricopeptide (TPR) repeat protein [Rheinheimera soli]
MKLLLSIGLVMLLTACQQNNIPTIAPGALLNDHLFNPVDATIETPEQIFALPEQTKAEIQGLTGSAQSIRVKTDLLLNYLFEKKGSSLLYQNDATLTAAETLAARQANCLSLTILSYSLAQEMGLNTEFRDIKIPEYWTQNNGQSLLNGHVNLNILGGRSIGKHGSINYNMFNYVIDFDVQSNKSHFPSVPLKQPQIIGMFYNNKAAEAMIYGKDDLAYAYLKAAISVDPQAAESWNNLAVLYRQKQHFELAEKAYLLAAKMAPDQLNSRANLALLYEVMGQTDKATHLKRIVAAKRELNPYYHIMLGHESLASGLPLQAIEYYKKSLTLDKKSAEAMFGLAKAHLSLGQKAKAQQYLQSAEQSAPNRSERERYQYKLKLLTAAAAQH